jgi:O-antigen biosynthesis protein
MPQISIIIVNYNVQYFLELCLSSVFKAAEGMDVEVFVVDNHSSDGSCDMVRAKFPQVKLLANKENLGFGKANNQAAASAKGKYILFLNPDTIVGETTFSHCFAFMEQHPKAGAMGVYMVDGEGKFLRESKRALPTPLVSFYKIFGLSALFPRSKRFSHYHLGYLDNQQTHKVEILSGAYMFMRKSVLDTIGLFDEQFFMYGEDIDLSYRVLLAGFDNYYVGPTHIIHFKGESTKKGSLNYVRVFYKAMEIFARKHFTGLGFTPMRLAIESAIWLRAALAMLTRMVGYLVAPLWRLVKSKTVVLQNRIFRIGVVAPADFFDLFVPAEKPSNVELVRLDVDAFVDGRLENRYAAEVDIMVLPMDALSNSSIIDLLPVLGGIGLKTRIVAPGSVDWLSDTEPTVR